MAVKSLHDSLARIMQEEDTKKENLIKSLNYTLKNNKKLSAEFSEFLKDLEQINKADTTMGGIASKKITLLKNIIGNDKQELAIVGNLNVFWAGIRAISGLINTELILLKKGIVIDKNWLKIEHAEREEIAREIIAFKNNVNMLSPQVFSNLKRTIGDNIAADIKKIEEALRNLAPKLNKLYTFITENPKHPQIKVLSEQFNKAKNYLIANNNRLKTLKQELASIEKSQFGKELQLRFNTELKKLIQESDEFAKEIKAVALSEKSKENLIRLIEKEAGIINIIKKTLTTEASGGSIGAGVRKEIKTWLKMLLGAVETEASETKKIMQEDAVCEKFDRSLLKSAKSIEPELTELINAVLMNDNALKAELSKITGSGSKLEEADFEGLKELATSINLQP